MQTRSPQNQGISILEVLSTVAIIALISSVALPIYHRVVDGTKLTKLENDVATINTSINVYLGSGGSLEGMEEPQAVLDRLKTVADRAIIGLERSMLDKRLRAKMQTLAQARLAGPRAVFNPTSMRFSISKAGSSTVGVDEFVFDDTLALVDYGTENREGLLSSEDNSGWLWAYSDEAGATLPAPTVIPLLVVNAIPVAPPIQPYLSEPTPSGAATGPNGEPNPEPATLPAPTIAVETVSGTGSGADYAELTAFVGGLLPSPSPDHLVVASGATADTTADTPADAPPAPSVDLLLASGAKSYLVSFNKESSDEESRIRYTVTTTLNGATYESSPAYYTDKFIVIGENIVVTARVVPLVGSDLDQSDEVVWAVPLVEDSNPVVVTPAGNSGKPRRSQTRVNSDGEAVTLVEGDPLAAGAAPAATTLAVDRFGRHVGEPGWVQRWELPTDDPDYLPLEDVPFKSEADRQAALDYEASKQGTTETTTTTPTDSNLGAKVLTYTVVL